MRIIIIGAGRTGQNLAAKLCEERHDVVLIDTNASKLAEIDSSLDILSVHGPGSSPEILKEAGINKTDMLVATTHSDEVNILSCIIAHGEGVKYKVARLINLDYANFTDNYNLNKLGINLVVSQYEECAKEIYNILQMPGTLEVVNLMGGKALAVGLKLPTDTPLIYSKLKDFKEADRFTSIRFFAHNDGKKVTIPTGETHFHIGDDVYLSGTPNSVKEFMRFAFPDETDFDRVIIAGGGRLGLLLAQLLEKDINRDVILIELDKERAEFCSDHLHSGLIINGDCLDQDELNEINITDNTAFVALTGDDEKNIMSCLMAEKMGAHFTLAEVSNSDYSSIIENLSLLDRVVSPNVSMINSIYHFVRGKNVLADAALNKIQGEILELYMGPEHPWKNKSILDISLPKGVIISMVLRDGKALVATGDFELKLNDCLLIYSKDNAMKKLKKLID